MADDGDDFERQLQLEKEEHYRQEQGYTYTDPNDGTEYEWDVEKQAWFPKVDEDFLAAYQANYGVNTNEQSVKSYYQQYAAQLAAEQPKLENSDSEDDDDEDDDDDDDETPEGAKKAVAQEQKEDGGEGLKAKGGQKRKGDEGWFELDEDKNTNVYVSGLPLDITPQEFEEFMQKCGVIVFDEEKQENKIKLYLDKHGNIKGDGRCCYLKRESVDLAIRILDESELRGNRVHVEPAKFEMKGDYKSLPKKKKQKKKKKNFQEKLLDWRPEKKFHQRKRNEQVVIIKHLFHPDEFEEDAMIINEIKDDLQSECSKFGEVKKVLIFDRHPDGVASVKFRDVEFADKCVESLNGRWFAKRQLLCELWDGVTDYKIEETDKEREERINKWDNFLADDEKTTTESGSSGKPDTQDARNNQTEQSGSSSARDTIQEGDKNAGSNMPRNNQPVDAT